MPVTARMFFPSWSGAVGPIPICVSQVWEILSRDNASAACWLYTSLGVVKIATIWMNHQPHHVTQPEFGGIYKEGILPKHMEVGGVWSNAPRIGPRNWHSTCQVAPGPKKETNLPIRNSAGVSGSCFWGFPSRRYNTWRIWSQTYPILITCIDPSWKVVHLIMTDTLAQDEKGSVSCLSAFTFSICLILVVFDISSGYQP